MNREMRAVCPGVHVLDVLVRPVESIPEGQGGLLVDEIEITAAGSAGGTAITLAKLGAEVRSAGCDRARRRRRDAFSAGFLRGIALERAPTGAAWGCAAAALVAGGLGSDYGEFGLADVAAMAAQAA